VLRSYAHKPFQNKEAAPLFSPTIYDGKRSKANATTTGAIIIDADDGLLFDEALASITAIGLEAVLYTTASNKIGDRFRIVIPLTTQTDPDTYKRVLVAICRVISGRDWKGDAGKIGPYNLFYVPGIYRDAENRFETVSGIILSAEDWLELGTVDPEGPQPTQPPGNTKPIDTTWTTLADCPFVRGAWLDEYRNLGPGQWYVGLYRFMVHVAMSARVQGYALAPGQVADLARELDRLDGGWYPDRDLEGEAENALAFARTHGTATTGSVAADIWDEEDEGPNEVERSEWQDDTGIKTGHGELIDEIADPDTPDEGRCAVSDTGHLPRISPLAGVSPYCFEDQLFAGRDGQSANPAFHYLARRCIALGDQFFIKIGHHWEPHNKGNAYSTLLQMYTSVTTEPAITKSEVKAFLRDAIVKFHGSSVFPGSPEFVWFQGRRYINTWRDQRAEPCIDDIVVAEIILRIIRENLCNADSASMEDMVLECTGEQNTIFRWVMHWLASIYRRPGHHIGTALWFVDKDGGVGKGTLLSILRDLLGSRWVGKANRDEMGRGWTDFLADKLLIEADEFEIGSRTELKQLFKQLIGNPLIQITKRHVGAFMVPNCLNYILTTNELHPIQIDRYDRRHTLVRTTDDPDRRGLALSFHVDLTATERAAAIRGFAAILSTIEIDDRLISRPFLTAHRVEIIGWSLSAVERWFMATDVDWVVGVTRTADQAYQDFRRWAEDHDSAATVRMSNIVTFGKEMTARLIPEYVSRGKSSSAVYTKIKYHDSATSEIVKQKQMMEMRAELIRDSIDERSTYFEKMMLDDATAGLMQ